MKRTIKNFLPVMFILTFIVVLTVITSVSSSAEEYSGNCGETLIWTLDTDNGVFKVSGTGDMDDYSYVSYNGSNVTTAPWQEHYSSVKTVVIGDGVTSIGKYAFYGCRSLTEITLPKVVTDIGKHAFNGCKSLTNVYIDDIGAWCGITFNGYMSNPLYYAKELYVRGEPVSDLVIPDSVDAIGTYSFYRSRFLKSVVIPDSVKSIGYRAFTECVVLKNVDMGKGVEIIDGEAFMDCPLLTDVVIPDSVTSIGDCAFENCSSIISIDIPDSVIKLNAGSFKNCTSLASVTIGDSVTELGYNVFYGCTSLVDVTVGVSVTTVDSCAFFGCSALKNVVFSGNSVTTIGSEVFQDCTSLTEIDIPDSVTEMGNRVFYRCTSLVSIDMPDTVKSIGASCFSECTSLISVAVSSSLIEIPWYAFSGCTALESIVLPSVEIIGNSAFENCTALSSVDFGDSLERIEYSAFLYCTSLTEVTLPPSVRYMGREAFAGCTSIAGVYIADIKEWCSITFFDCWSNPLFYAGKLYLNGKPVTDVHVTDGAKAINSFAFINCDTVKTLIVSEPAERIGNYAFYDCDSIENIILMKSVKHIGEKAFGDCDSLTSVTVPTTVLTFGDYAFPETVLIRCYNGSFAWSYAINNDYSTEPISCEHSFTSYISDNNATCVSDGTKTAKCDLCGITDTFTEEGTVQGHIWGEWYITVEPTYDWIGEKERKCSVCLNKDIQSINTKKIEDTFSDIKSSHWFYYSVEFVVKKGYMNGMSETKFSPNSNITREQFVLILANIAGVDTNRFKNTESGFEDVKTGQWYSGAVTWAVREGYVSGMSSTKFGRGQSIQRAALARMLYNYASKNGINVEGRADLSSFGDAKEFDKAGNAWMKEPVQWAVDAGIISGMNVNGKNCVNPKGTATRAQAARMLMQFNTFQQKSK